MVIPTSTSVLSKFLTDDPSSPYFLRNGNDYSHDSLVSELLNGDNYVSWSRAMIMALSGKNKQGFIDGTVPKPYSDNSAEYRAWRRVDDVVMTWIIKSLDKEIADSVINPESAYELWKDLKERFHQSSGPRIFKLRQEIVNLKQNQDTVTVYFTKLKKLWEELSYYRPACACGGCTCGGFRNLCGFLQSEYVMSFLMGLNESLSQIRGQILLLEPLPTMNKVFSLVFQEERRRIRLHGFGNSEDQNSAVDPAVQIITEDSTLNMEENEEDKMIFETREELLNHVKAFCLEQGYATAIKNSKKDLYVRIGCDRGGIYRNDITPSKLRKRNSSSRLINCPFEVLGKRQRNGNWLLEHKDLTHNHEASTDMSTHPSCCRLSEEEMIKVEELTNSGIPPREIMSSLRERNPNLIANYKTIYNSVQKIRRSNLGEQTIIQGSTESEPSRYEIEEKKARKCSKCRSVGHDMPNCVSQS